jgi:hypothetical protein
MQLIPGTFATYDEETDERMTRACTYERPHASARPQAEAGDDRPVCEPVFLGIDIGTGSSKRVAVRADGRVLARATRPHRTATPRPGWFEHDAETVWWADFTGIVRELLAADAADRPLRPAILYGVDTVPRVVGRHWPNFASGMFRTAPRTVFGVRGRADPPRRSASYCSQGCAKSSAGLSTLPRSSAASAPTGSSLGTILRSHTSHTSPITGTPL